MSETSTICRTLRASPAAALLFSDARSAAAASASPKRVSDHPGDASASRARNSATRLAGSVSFHCAIESAG